MATISANGAKGHHKFTLTVTETGTSTASNTSTISFSFTLSPVQTGWDWSGWSNKISYSVVINGTTYTGTIPSYNGSSTVTLKSGTQSISHNADGKKTISYSFSVTDSAGQSYTCGNASKSGTLALTDIPRQATLLTAPNIYDGQNPTITYSNPAGTVVESLEVCISWTGYPDIAYRAVSKTGNSYTFALTSAEWGALRSATQSNSLAIKFYIRTKINGENYLHNLSRTFYIGDANPIITASVEDTNATTIALTGNKNKLIKYFSNAKATMSATAQKGATINESLYIIRNGNRTGYGKTYTFNNVEDNEFSFSAEDSRGNVGTEPVTPNMVNYVKLTCNLYDSRPDGEGKMLLQCTGNCFIGSFGAVTNTLEVQCRYKVNGGTYGKWQTMTFTKSGNSYSASASLTGLDYQKAYVFEVKATDSLMTVTKTSSAVKAIPMFHWGENDFVFEVPVTFNAGFDGDSTDQGIWTPTLNSSAISSYTTRYGWYMKMNQTVTVGFFIKANCNSGYNSTVISISGLPFTPMYSAAGGGMCSGIYISAGFAFQCFVAETSGSITTRVQPCNNTSAANLGTSASGCFYRSGGGEITLSGTITFRSSN